MKSLTFKKIAVIIITYKFPKQKIKKLLDGLKEIGINSENIFVKDNTNDNIGYAGGINVILGKILKKYEYFLVLNPDITIKNDFLTPLANTLEKNEIDIVGPIIYTDNGKIWGSEGIIDKKRYSASMSTKVLKKTTFVDFVPGTAFLTKKEVFQKIGFFEEKYFLYYDEVDFCVRARRAGFRLAVNPNSTIVHFGSYTVGKNSNSMIYYMARSHMYFLEKFAPNDIKIREFIRLPKTLWQAKNRPYELYGILDYFFRKSGRNSNIRVSAD